VTWGTYDVFVKRFYDFVLRLQAGNERWVNTAMVSFLPLGELIAGCNGGCGSPVPFGY
jgi:hypothetical protein